MGVEGYFFFFMFLFNSLIKFVLLKSCIYYQSPSKQNKMSLATQFEHQIIINYERATTTITTTQ